MEEKESTVSVSPGDSETDSPPPISSFQGVAAPQVMNININMAAENNSISATTSPPTIGSDSGGISGAAAGVGGDLFRKKKRGRPRKYDSDGNLRVPTFHQSLTAGGVLSSDPAGFSFSLFSPPHPSDGFISSSKRGRGRPPGSGNWQLLASLGELFTSTAGGDFMPHVITVNTGEDVAGKILSFAQKGQRGLCVLSANGAVSNVTIRQPGSSGGILTYEGRFEILSLSGSFTVAENGGVRSRTGGLSVSLASPDGRVLGGGVAGLLLAASPIQIVLGSFIPNCYKVHKRKHHRENTVNSVTETRPITEAKPEEKKCTVPVPPLPETVTDNIVNAHQNQVPSSGCWNGSGPTSHHRPSPDINVSVLNEEDVQGVL